MSTYRIFVQPGFESKSSLSGQILNPSVRQSVNQIDKFPSNASKTKAKVNDLSDATCTGKENTEVFQRFHEAPDGMSFAWTKCDLSFHNLDDINFASSYHFIQEIDVSYNKLTGNTPPVCFTSIIIINNFMTYLSWWISRGNSSYLSFGLIDIYTPSSVQPELKIYWLIVRNN